MSKEFFRVYVRIVMWNDTISVVFDSYRSKNLAIADALKIIIRNDPDEQFAKLTKVTYGAGQDAISETEVELKNET